MDMKQLEISKLMDEYQDNEFLPEGGSTADIQAIKNRVLAQAVPAKKRRMPPLRTALLAAALTVGCMLMIAAGIPGTAYRILTGTITLERSEEGIRSVNLELDNSEPFDFRDDPVQLEDGRIFFVLDGRRTDITDLIDVDTPYIYDDSNPSAGTFHYLIVGGAQERYGWLEWFEGPQPFEWQQDEKVIVAGMEDYTWCAYVVKMISDGGNRKTESHGSGAGYSGFSKDLQSEWLRSALDSLGILMDESEREQLVRTRPGIYFVP